MKDKAIEQNLYDIASLQQGYFTAHQAKKAGYSDSRFAYHVKKGNWSREGRGIYRLVNYPLSERPDLVYWSLWSINRQGQVQGVFSHETALAIHELSDVMPAKYHMTVPKGFRRYHPCPQNIVLYFANLLEEEIVEFEGYRVTNPRKTIQDALLDEGISEELVIQAIIDGLDQGIVSLDQVSEFKKNLKSNRVNRILKGIAKNER
jgi:predicted transcriptional regulator of viral defense system